MLTAAFRTLVGPSTVRFGVAIGLASLALDYIPVLCGASIVILCCLRNGDCRSLYC